jgi:hypothetical protein
MEEGKGARSACAEAGKGGSGTDKGVNAVDAAAGRHTSHEAGENRGVRSHGPVPSGCYGPAQHD